MSEYDPCIANKIINNKQCTIGWHVDDMMLSHDDTNVVTQVIRDIEEHFGEMTVTRGRKHVFLGMDIEFHDNGTFSICMSDYLQEAIDEFGEDLEYDVPHPAVNDLFKVGTSKQLDTRRSDIFHRVTAKLLYVCMRGRPDIQPTVAYLCTRVSKSNERDYAKLRRLLRFIRGTINDRRYIGADGFSVLHTWVDVSFAVHDDMKSHTGGAMSFGTGVISTMSSKQKLNTKSTTESEFVGASDYLARPIWTKGFMEEQGKRILETFLHQDNESAIKLEVNGITSSSQRTRHISIKYFFVKDRLESENIQVVFCPTDEMIADFFTKPLQGSLFQKLRSIIMGYTHVPLVHVKASEERVGNK